MHTGVPSADKITAKLGSRNFVLFLKCKSDASVTGNSPSVVCILFVSIYIDAQDTPTVAACGCIKMHVQAGLSYYNNVYIKMTYVYIIIVTYDNTSLEVLSRLRVNLGVHIIISYTIRIKEKD